METNQHSVIIKPSWYQPARGLMVVLGAGESGVGTAILAKKMGYEVWVSDGKPIKEHYKKELLEFAIAFEENNHDLNKILSAQVVMKSPGIPNEIPLIKNVEAANIPIVSEIEFAYYFSQAPCVAITGSNGKTTTTKLVYHLLQNANLNVGLGGNIGISYAKQVALAPKDLYVLEVSSFQLEHIECFKPFISIITNISPDHLDRYQNDMNFYVATKFNITKAQTSDDYFIYDHDDAYLTNYIKNHEINATMIPFSLTKELTIGTFIKQDIMQTNFQSESQSWDTKLLTIDGKHNQKNAMAAVSVATLLKIRKDSIRESLKSFEGVEHRLEKVAKVNQVQYINDSKATNVNSVFYALESMNAPTVWIVGGVDKGNDYAELVPLVMEKVKAIVCLGIDNQKIIEAFGHIVDVMVEVDSMDQAVKTAQRIGEKGDVVLLSPACASFDLFENYEDRGNQFKTAVRML